MKTNHALGFCLVSAVFLPVPACTRNAAHVPVLDASARSLIPDNTSILIYFSPVRELEPKVKSFVKSVSNVDVATLDMAGDFLSHYGLSPGHMNRNEPVIATFGPGPRGATMATGSHTLLFSPVQEDETLAVLNTKKDKFETRTGKGVLAITEGGMLKDATRGNCKLAADLPAGDVTIRLDFKSLSGFLNQPNGTVSMLGALWTKATGTPPSRMDQLWSQIEAAEVTASIDGNTTIASAELAFTKDIFDPTLRGIDRTACVLAALPPDHEVAALLPSAWALSVISILGLQTAPGMGPYGGCSELAHFLSGRATGEAGVALSRNDGSEWLVFAVPVAEPRTTIEQLSSTLESLKIPGAKRDPASVESRVIYTLNNGRRVAMESREGVVRVEWSAGSAGAEYRRIGVEAAKKQLESGTGSSNIWIHYRWADPASKQTGAHDAGMVISGRGVGSSLRLEGRADYQKLGAMIKRLPR